MAFLIKSGKLITAEQTMIADILVDQEKIVQVGQDLPVSENMEVVDAAGKLVMPGGVDVHTHFDLPMAGTVSSDDHYTGHKAAACGGTTTVIDFIPQDLPTLKANVEQWHAKADGKAAVDFGFHMNITHLDAQIEAQIPGLVSEGISSVKVFMAYNGRLRLSDGEIFRVLRVAGRHGMLTMLHAENGDVIDILVDEAVHSGHLSPAWHGRTRPAWGAVEAVLRGAALAGQADASLYIVHMNAGGEVDQLRYARQKGLRVMGETCPSYLFFTEESFNSPEGAKFVCSPPLRRREDGQQLWQGVQDGVIQTIATDHCPFFFDGTKAIEYEGKPVMIPGKELGADNFTKIPNGLPGVGDRLPILWTYGVGTGRLTPNQFVALTSTQPAKIFGMFPQKGSLQPGADADLLIWDPQKNLSYGVSHASHRTDYNLFEGWELTGFPERVYLRGHLIVDKTTWLGKPGMGQFLHRNPGAEIL